MAGDGALRENNRATAKTAFLKFKRRHGLSSMPAPRGDTAHKFRLKRANFPEILGAANPMKSALAISEPALEKVCRPMAATNPSKHRSRSRHAAEKNSVYPRGKLKMPAATGEIAANIQFAAIASRKKICEG